VLSLETINNWIIKGTVCRCCFQ